MEALLISSCVRFAERMAVRVRRAQLEEARLMKESCKTIRAPSLTKVRRSSGFGKGMLRKNQWIEGQPRITQAACAVVAQYAKARLEARANGQYVGRKSYAERAGISTATLNRCADEMVKGQIFLDPNDGQWKLSPVQS